MQSLLMSAPGRSVAPFRIPKRIPPSQPNNTSRPTQDSKRRKLDAGGAFVPSSGPPPAAPPPRPAAAAPPPRAPLATARKRPLQNDNTPSHTARPATSVPRSVPVPGYTARHPGTAPPLRPNAPRPSPLRAKSMGGGAPQGPLLKPPSQQPPPVRSRPLGPVKALPSARPSANVPRRIPPVPRPVPKMPLGGNIRARPPLRPIVPTAMAGRRPPLVPGAPRTNAPPVAAAKAKAGLKSKATPKEPGVARPKAGGGRALMPKPTLKAGVPQPCARPRPVVPGGMSMRPMHRPAVQGRGMMPRRGGFMMGARRAPPMNYDPYGVEEPTEEDLDFIDDTPDDEEEWRRELRSITGYDPAEYAEKDLEEALETDIYKQSREEMLSSMIAQKEDAEELRQIMAEADDEEDEEDDEDEEEEEEEEDDEGSPAAAEGPTDNLNE